MTTTTSRIHLEDALDHRIKQGTIDAEGVRMMRRSIDLLKQRERFERAMAVRAAILEPLQFGMRP